MMRILVAGGVLVVVWVGMWNVRRWRLDMVKLKKKGSQIVNQLWIVRKRKWMWDSHPFISLILSPK